MTRPTFRSELTEKSPGAEPLPGYRLIAPLGRGGFGEVWKCEAPGGLQKAIKFVPADGERFRQELAAFEKVRTIRHPFLLALDRVELAGGELVMVMELADCQLMDRFRVCQKDGLLGIPREELVHYLEEAAESLDMIGTRYGLQHLDVKPENLFLVSGHAKVGDFGLVRRARRIRVGTEENYGFTPRYAPPEVLMGRVDTRSDQYSLALVYAELLCGVFPFPGQTPQELMVQHLHQEPDLSRIGSVDQSIVARALSKQPGDRFLSCQDFVKTLANVRNETGKALPVPSGCSINTPIPGNISNLRAETVGISPSGSDEPSGSRGAIEQASRQFETVPNIKGPIPRRNKRVENVQKNESLQNDPFAGLQQVMPVNAFNGTTVRVVFASTISSNEYVNHLVQAASNSTTDRRDEGESEGVLVSRFLCTLPAAMVPFKLGILRETWNLTIVQPDSSRIVLWKDYAGESCKRDRSESEFRKPGMSINPSPGVLKPAGLEVVVQRAIPQSAEFTIRGSICGILEESHFRKANRDLQAIMTQVQKQLQNLDERRKRARIPTDFAVRIYPLYPDGIVGLPIGGRCQDLSHSGVRLMTASPIRTERAYVEFHEVLPVSGYAVYVRVVRTSQDLETQATITAGRFKSRT